MLITLPLYLILFIYFGFLFVFGLFIGINFYHIVSGGILTKANFIITALIIGTTIFTLFGTYQLLQNTDWQQRITLFDSAWITNTIPETSL